MKPFALFSCRTALIASALALASCFGAPERCNNCVAFIDAGPPDESTPDVPIATGGATGSGGMIVSTGGTSSGGMTGSGGANTGGANTGGANTGGMATGGRGGSNTGGANTGGANTGGANTGGANTGGRGTGGANGGAGGGSTGGAGGAAVDPDLVLWYKFDNNATDSAKYGGTSRDATLTVVGGSQAGYSTTHQVGTHSLNIAGTSSTVGGYAKVPNLQTLLPGAVTISCWVYVKGNQNWQRVYDFGTMASTPLIYMFLTTNQAQTSPNSVRFSIGTMGNGKEEVINMTTPGTLSLNAWHHLAVVLPAGATYTGTLYIDGMVAGTNTAMTIHPSGIAMPDSFIGRSQWTNDPYFNGNVDDFRVYRRALTAAEITALRAVTQ